MSSLTAARVLQIATGRAPRCGAVRVIAVDGGAAAGKSTFATELREQAVRRGDRVEVVATDDLLDGWAGQFTYDTRLTEQVLLPLSRDQPGNYRRFDWHSGRFDAWVAVAVSDVLIIEGVGSIAACAGFTVATVFLDVPRAEREERWVRRDGIFQAEWQTWLDAEEGYRSKLNLAAVDVVLRAGE